MKSNIFIYTPTTLRGNNRKWKRGLVLEDQTHALQWKRATPPAFNMPAGNAIPHSQIRGQPYEASNWQQTHFSTTLKFISALKGGHTHYPLRPVARSYVARWIPQQRLAAAVNVPPSWHLGFPFIKLWTMAKLTYNLLRLL
jgi:hypothetical protein